MGRYLADVAIHIDEDLEDPRLTILERDLLACNGVVSARHRTGFNHLLLVNFDPDETRSCDLLQPLRARGLHAQLIGF